MLSAIIAWVLSLKYIALFPAMILEGPIVTIIAGSLAASGQLSFLGAYAIIVAGDLASDSLYYAIGRFGRNSFLKRWGKYVGLTEERMRHVDKHFIRHAAKTLFIGKFALSVEPPFMVAAGIAHYSYARFMAIMFAGALPKSLAFMLIGYFFGFSLTSAKHDLLLASRFALVGLALATAILIARYIARHHPYLLEASGLAKFKIKDRMRGMKTLDTLRSMPASAPTKTDGSPSRQTTSE